MCGLRESKKAATRATLARAAATIALREGVEKLTVVAITEAAGVSQRTFHNYFSSREEALSFFMSERIHALANRMREFPADTPIPDAVELIAVEGLKVDTSDPGSFVSLMKLGQIVEMIAPTMFPHAVINSLKPIIDELSTLYPERSLFEVKLLLDVSATTARVAMESHFEQDRPEDREAAIEKVHLAFEILRNRINP
ncbi:TetR/AcrR family transcriptional regulator [Corynebacterium pacaense]|uniref:TetR/AcrR family transcriptional regulator n=1 Tax=Corynebacterium pacaense TaxID=1816684 RepID=UPI0009B95765|nr:TetR/AcrR family transcriptional regulator [Corynebacterium pacaense]